MRIHNLSRRAFLKTSVLAGGGLLLGVRLPGLAPLADAALAGTPAASLNAFVRIGTDETVTIIVNHSEMGQGAYTSGAMLVAEELAPDWSRVRVEAAPVDPVYNHPGFGMQATGGSTSTWSEWERLRKAGAAAREMLVAAAADAWKVEPAACRASDGKVVHTASGRSLSYGKLVDQAAERTPPEDVPLKDPKDFTLIGRPTKRLDTPAKINGTAIFGIDVTLPGLKVAVVARPPVFGAKLKSFKADRAKEVPGVRDVIAIPRGVAVVADGFWPAKLGRDALEIAWDEGPLAALDTATQGDDYAALAGQPGVTARKDGDPAAAFEAAARKLEATYDLPYLAHAPMEPLNAVADVRPDGCDVWVGTQFQTIDYFAAAQDAGVRPDQVNLHTTFLGGGFGRRGVLDSHFVREAVQLSKAVKAPVKVIWTREDDTRGGFYRPRAHHRLRAGLDANGAPVAWEHHVVCQSFAMGTALEGFVVKDGVDHTAVEGASELPYAVANVRVDWHRAPDGVPTHFWRSVGHSHNGFVVESFIDELAHAAGRDPLKFRLDLLEKQPRHRRLLELLAEKADWEGPVRNGRGRGVAIHESFGSLTAHVAEVSIRDGRPSVHRIVCAVDCGFVVNPDGVRAQMESAIVYALSAALHGEITFEKGRVRQGNFHEYPVLRMNEMPEVEVHVAPSGDKMGGVGEPGVPPVAPAVANAIFAVTGRRIRRLPIRAQDLK